MSKKSFIADYIDQVIGGDTSKFYTFEENMDFYKDLQAIASRINTEELPKKRSVSPKTKKSQGKNKRNRVRNKLDTH